MALLGPYLVYLGTKTDARYPYIFIGILCISGGIASAFLPETLHQKLPETLADAEQFGKHQTFWSVPKKPVHTSTRR
ncbi:hypothetical protein C0J52_25982 [Blattella germanica]|nr:hypothetical protein C0J52_25982 [Blattella germanica]